VIVAAGNEPLVLAMESQLIVGTGVDIVDLDRLQDLIDRHGMLFLGKTFTEAEIAYCQRHKVPVMHFGGRFAAKEAMFKALGTGWREGIGWKQVEVQADARGRPRIRLSGRAAVRARKLGITEIFLSISHCKCHAIAQVIAEGVEDTGQ